MRVMILLLVTAVGLSGCTNPPVTGDIVIGRATRLSIEAYRETLQFEKEHPEAQHSVFVTPLGVGIPLQALKDGRVLTANCQKHSNYGLLHERFVILLPKGINIADRTVVVEFEAVSSNWDRATQSTTYEFSRFIRVSDLGIHDVPDGCLWYHNGKLVEGTHAGAKWTGPD